jgi:hypothetical protein
MNLNRIINEVPGLNNNLTPDNYIKRKISMFKSGMITSVIITVISVIIILSVFLYIGFMVIKNL